MFRTLVVLTCLSILSVATPALAQIPSPPPVDSRTFRASIAAVKFDTASAEKLSASRPVMRQAKKMGTGERIGWTALAGLGGFFAGAYIGAAIEGDRCECDDPGLKGALIGMPIGTAAAAITTWVLTGR
jgi:hypothetical protein